MNNLIQTILRLFLVGSLIILIGCGKDNEVVDEQPEGKGARLKHLTTAADIQSLLGSLQEDYTVDRASFTDVGSYPVAPYTYYYDLNWSWNQGNNLVTAHRTLSCSAGMGNDTKEEILRSADGFVEIQDARFGKPPYDNVFAIKYVDQKKSDWRFEIHILKTVNNMRNQAITLSGSYGPVYREDIEAMAPNPPEDNVVITELLKLLEAID